MTVTAPARISSIRKPSLLARWHLLSLDAPTVAALWTFFIARVFKIELTVVAPMALGLAVWMLYAADRLNDARHGGDLQQRHHFHFQHRRAFTVALACAAPVLAVLVANLPHGLRAGWMYLSIPLLIYIVVVHGFHVARIPKEAIVGLSFGLATFMPMLMHGPLATPALFPSALLFSAVCYLNGVAIFRWECCPEFSTDGVTAWLAQRFSVAGGVLAVAGILLVLQRQGRAVAVACLFSTCLLLLLDRTRTGFQRLQLRALADAALLTPFVVWPFLPMFPNR